MRLKAAKNKLIWILYLSINARGVNIALAMEPDNSMDMGMIITTMASELRIASNTFVIGPAAADMAISRLGSLKL